VNVTLTNTTGAAQTYSLAVSGPAAGVFSVSPSSVTLAAGASGAVTVTMNSSQGAATGGKQAYLEVGAGAANVAHAALYTVVK
jgi:minor extracellular serine protease Vpr